MSVAPTELTPGPNLLNWAPDKWCEFYFRIADEAPVSVVYLGETICSKRAPLFDDDYPAVSERLGAAGKTVVHSTLGETASKLDRGLVSDVCERTSDLIEANDASAAYQLRGRPHSYFLYDRGSLIDAGPILEWMFPRMGGISVHRGKLDRQSLRKMDGFRPQ